MAKLFQRKRDKGEHPPQEKMSPEKKSALVLANTHTRTSVFFHEKEIICHKERKAFSEVIIYEKTTGKKKKTTQKRIPLCCERAEKTERGLEMLFSAKGHSIKLDLIEEEKQLHIKIKKAGEHPVNLHFPRGTKEDTPSFLVKKKAKTKEKGLFCTRSPNVEIEDFFYNLKTAKGWTAEINDREIIYQIKGEKAKLFIIKAGSPENNIKFYYSQDNIPETREIEKGIYFTTDAEKAIEKMERLSKSQLAFDGAVFSYDAARLDEFVSIARRAKRLEKELVLKLKPYLPVKMVGEINASYLVQDKKGKLLIEEIDGQKYYAINLALRDARRWLQNQIRNYLDFGAKGIIAECGHFDEERAALPPEERFSYGETWYILWQRLVKEVVDEYPNRFLLLRHNGAKSPKYGVLMTDEASWSDIEKERIERDIQKYALCGMGSAVITELGGINNSGEKAFLNAEKWFLLCRNMPLIIFGRVPEKVVKKYFYLLDEKESRKT